MKALIAATLICLGGSAGTTPCATAAHAASTRTAATLASTAPAASRRDDAHRLLAGLALMAAIAARRHGGRR